MNARDKEILKHLDDPRWRLNNLYHIMDEKGQDVLFQFNDVQNKLYSELWWMNIVPKSRQHGITTFLCIMFLDRCIFNGNVRAAIICHRFESAKKIFRDKIKYAYEHLPEYIKNLCPLEGKIKGDELIFKNNSSVYVDTSIRSGTCQLLHISEYDYICKHAPERAEEIKRGGLEAVHEGSMVFIESTSEGCETDFKHMCREAGTDDSKLTRLDFKRHFFGWHDDPKNRLVGFNGEISPELTEYFDGLELIFDKTIDLEQRGWYQSKKKTHGFNIYKEQPSTFEEAFSAASEGAYFGAEMTYLKENERLTFVPHDPQAKVFTFWDTGNTYTSICFLQFNGDKVKCIDHYFDDLGQGIPHFAQVLRDKPYIYADHYAGPDIDPDKGSNNKSFQTGQKTVDIARKLGINFKIIPSHNFSDRIQATKDFLKRCWMDEDKAKTLYTGLTNFRRRKNNQLSTKDRPVYFDEPVRDTIDIHIADSFGHAAIWYAMRKSQGRSFDENVVHKSIFNKVSCKPRHLALLGFGKRKAV